MTHLAIRPSIRFGGVWERTSNAAPPLKSPVRFRFLVWFIVIFIVITCAVGAGRSRRECEGLR